MISTPSSPVWEAAVEALDVVVSDFLYWKVSDIDLNNRTVAYHSPKVNTYNNIPLHPKLIPILRTRISEVNSGRIFEYTNEKNLGHAFKRFLKALNIDRPEYTLRTFRKHFISLMQKQKMPITMVAKLVGHKKIETTNKYYTYFSTEDMSNELEKIKF